MGGPLPIRAKAARRAALVVCVLVTALWGTASAQSSTLAEGESRTNGAQAALPSWRGTTRDRIVDFVATVTEPGGAGYVPPEERIAVFDNDGTLWSEQPLYFQLLYAIDYVKQHADDHPEWRTTQPFKAAIEGDTQAMAATGEEGLVKLVMASHAGMTSDEFDASVRSFLSSARHPEKNQLYTALVYQPMLELLDYLRANDFSTWIVSGGGIDFLRSFAESVYGVPPEQVVGSSVEIEFEMRDTGPVLVRQPSLNFVNDQVGKPVGIHRHIGRRPVAAFGNSDGDLQMLQWTVAGDGPRLAALVHHTDAEREWAYDEDSQIGRLDAALEQARSDGWLIIDMESDWTTVYPSDSE